MLLPEATATVSLSDVTAQGHLLPATVSVSLGGPPYQVIYGIFQYFSIDLCACLPWNWLSVQS